MWKKHTFVSCPRCLRRHRSPIELEERGKNWSVPAFCDECKKEYVAYLGETSHELACLARTNAETMEGWSERQAGNRRGAPADRYANKHSGNTGPSFA